MGVNTDRLRKMATLAFSYADDDRDQIHMAADEIDILRLVVSRLNHRCDAVAKVTTSPVTYDLLNDAAWKVEQEIREEMRDG